jgi:hypothetical protein
MNPQSPPRPLHVPTLTEVIDAPAVIAPPHAAADATVSAGEAGAAGGADVPRNLLRSAAPAAEAFAAASLPGSPPMMAGLAAPPPTHAPNPDALLAARVNLSGALRSARDGRWASTGPGELPAMEALLEAPVQAMLPEVDELPLAPPPAPLVVPASEVTEVTEAQLAHRVLGVVQKQIDGMLDFRLREAMTPILQRHTDALVRELRDELKQTMQDVINRAVAQEMAKVRQR